MTSEAGSEGHADRIDGLVAGILNERELAINVGGEKGVREDMKFRVMADAPVEIRDPKTQEVLGMVNREKVRVRATQVYPKFSVCRTYKVFRTPGGWLWQASGGGLLAGANRPPREYPETLKAEESDYLPDLPEDESFVKKGDRVIQLAPGEED